ncbi:MAG: D-aminoacyl-tRNA deacylase, partial [Planctomycetota bacterium]
MRMLLQRVAHASVTVEGEVVGRIERGYLVLLGVTHGDDEATADRLCDKLVKLRVFPNEQGEFDRSVLDINGGVLVVSQFTLYGNPKKGNRPSFTDAASPEVAEPLCAYVVEALEQRGVGSVQTGIFGADMKVELLNDGPVTLMLDSATL